MRTHSARIDDCSASNQQYPFGRRPRTGRLDRELGSDLCVRAIHTPQRCARADRVHFGRYGERYMVQYRPHGARAEPGLSHLVRRAAARVVH